MDRVAGCLKYRGWKRRRIRMGGKQTWVYDAPDVTKDSSHHDKYDDGETRADPSSVTMSPSGSGGL
jgi:hypothetical protein